MPKDDIESKSFTFVSTGPLFVYENKYYLPVYLGNCAYKIVKKQITDCLDIRYYKYCVTIELAKELILLKVTTGRNA